MPPVSLPYSIELLHYKRLLRRQHLLACGRELKPGKQLTVHLTEHLQGTEILPMLSTVNSSLALSLINAHRLGGQYGFLLR